ncbi:threonine-phosphate decarboxylase CobD [Thermohalobacter berrensis]|uniref:threonine-phosphate decarboxylase CobD n=1 Tax=Thermohalobacter berrensis TaxID=99594 RepID=UPI000E72700A|nr:threonine-phosphate decarboxylase CobD [Thermohalobacter berrensis]
MNKHGGYYGKKNNVIDFSVNINPLGVSEKVLEKLKESLKNIVKYPEIDGLSARKKLAEKLGLDYKEIILGNGATELIYLFAKSIKAKKVIIIQPTFTEYKRAFKINGSKVYHFVTDKRDNFNIDITSLITKIKEVKPEVVIICNPNNPTGTFTEIERIIPVVNVLNEIGGFLFVDESFIDFTNEKSYLKLIYKYPIFIIRSMTKFFAVPGLRLGYGIGNKKIINRLNQYKEPWTLNSLSLDIIPTLLEDAEYIKMVEKWCNSQKEFLFSKLKDLDYIDVFPSKSNFYLCKLKKGNVNILKDKLLKRNIFIRTCEDFYALDDSFFRIAVKRESENMKLIEALKDMTLV